MKKVVRLTESDLIRIVKRVIQEDGGITFGDKVRDTLGGIIGLPKTTEDESRLADDILSAVESGNYEVLESHSGFIVPKGFKIEVSLNDGDYLVYIRKEKINYEGGSMTYTTVTTPDGKKVNIMAKGFTNKIINLVKKDGKMAKNDDRFRYPKK
jgi:hypothetical protein